VGRGLGRCTDAGRKQGLAQEFDCVGFFKRKFNWKRGAPIRAEQLQASELRLALPPTHASAVLRTNDMDDWFASNSTSNSK
jgi:hypothetical protein